MGNLRVRYLVARQLKSRTLLYWQPTAKLIAAGFRAQRLADDPLTAASQAEALNAALDRWYRGEAPPPKMRPGTLDALHSLFQTDDAFRALKDRSRRDYLYAIKPALEWAADIPVADITRKALRAWYRALRDGRGPSSSRNTMAVFRRLLSFAVDEGWIPVNPALKMNLTTPASRSRVWTGLERDAFIKQALADKRPSMATAVMIGWCTGQRPEDIRTMSWAAYDGSAISIRQGKTDQAVWVPALPELRRLLDALPRTAVQIVISEETKLPYRESDFQHRFAEIRKAAKLPTSLQFRDLRRTLATALGAAGCTDDQIRAITGHKTREVVGVYVRPDRTFAQGAMKRLQSAQRERKLKGS